MQVRKDVGFDSSVSMPCVTAMNRTPNERSSWTEETKCGMDRPQRSIFQHTMPSISRRLSASISRFMAARLSALLFSTTFLLLWIALFPLIYCLVQFEYRYPLLWTTCLLAAEAIRLLAREVWSGTQRRLIGRGAMRLLVMCA